MNTVQRIFLVVSALATLLAAIAGFYTGPTFHDPGLRACWLAISIASVVVSMASIYCFIGVQRGELHPKNRHYVGWLACSLFISVIACRAAGWL